MVMARILCQQLNDTYAGRYDYFSPPHSGVVNFAFADWSVRV